MTAAGQAPPWVVGGPQGVVLTLGSPAFVAITQSGYPPEIVRGTGRPIGHAASVPLTPGPGVLHHVAVDQDLRRALRIGVMLGLWLAGIYVVLDTFHLYAVYGGVGKDAHAYWLTAHTDKLYTTAPGTPDAYLYSPAFAQVVRPFAWALPFGVFSALCMVVDTAAFVWLLRPLGWVWTAPIMLFIVPELILGQVTGIITAAAVLAASGRGGWSAVGFLTKVTSGGLSVAWLFSRRDWRGLAAAVGWTAGISLLSFAFWPSAWFDWFHFLTSTSTPALTAVRGLAALVLVLLGGRRGWWWAIPVALVVSAPVLGGLYVLTALTGLARLSPSAQVDLGGAGSGRAGTLVASAKRA